MFNAITLRGVGGTILWNGLREAATLRAWTIYHHRPDSQHDARWTLTATFAEVRRFEIRQRPLLFTAPRPGMPRSCWPLQTESIQIGDTHLTAILGPPEQ